MCLKFVVALDAKTKENIFNRTISYTIVVMATRKNGTRHKDKKCAKPAARRAVLQKIEQSLNRCCLKRYRNRLLILRYPVFLHLRLTNTSFSNSTKKRIEACVIYDAKLSQIEEHGKVTDLKPKIDITVILAENKVKRQSTRAPLPHDKIVINAKSKGNNHKVSLYTSVGNKLLHLCAF